MADTVRSTMEQTHYPQGQQQLQPTADLLDYFREYTRQRPEVVALWALGIGFVLGWKLKPW